jgi:CubicO group peptidase (beta-lactamase class C family)
MYMVGANIVSTLSGMRYVDFVDSRIFKPLGMGSSTYSIGAAIQTGKFTGTWTSFGRLIPPLIEDEFVDLVAGPGGVISSVEELVCRAIRGPLDLTHISSRPFGPEYF